MKACWRNILETSTVTASTSASGYPSYRLYDGKMGLMWSASTSGDATITLDQGATTILPVSCLCIPKNHVFSGRQLTWQHSTNGSTWVDMIAAWTPSSSDLIYKTAAAQTKRYWRLYMVGGTPYNQCGELFLGDLVTFASGPTYDSEAGYEPSVTKVPSYTGVNHYVRNGDARRVVKYDVNRISSTEKAYYMDWFSLWDGSKPFVFVDQEDSAWFGEFAGDPKLKYEGVGIHSAQLEVREVL